MFKSARERYLRYLESTYDISKIKFIEDPKEVEKLNMKDVIFKYSRQHLSKMIEETETDTKDIEVELNKK